METQRDRNGLVARRKTIKPRTQFWNFAPIIALLLLLLSASCNHGTGGKERVADTAQKLAIADSLYKPKIDIKVNRRFDRKGNLIGFDSTYSSYYSNVMGDTSRMDSLIGKFDAFFNSRHPSFLRNEFNPLFFNDSLRYPDFFHDDFFLRRYELNDEYMRGMMKRMDSIKNDFYKNEGRHTKGA